VRSGDVMLLMRFIIDLVSMEVGKKLMAFLFNAVLLLMETSGDVMLKMRFMLDLVD